MLKRLKIENFTAFPEADLKFGRNLNLVVGENASGKTHLLKLAYSICAACWEQGRRAREVTRGHLQTHLADKLVGVFRPESLGRLARRRRGRERCEVHLEFVDRDCSVGFGFATNSKSEVSVNQLPGRWPDEAPVYLPTRELLSIYPGFVSVYEGHYLEFEETWRDTCLLLGAPLQRGPKVERVRQLLEPLETALEGRVELDRNGRFYLNGTEGRMEIPLVAEGLRKVAMLARLVATGAILEKGYLFWDEPEANLNPRLIKSVARSLLDLSTRGLQVFLATHSLFLLREIEILLKDRKVDPAFFGLHRSDHGVNVLQGPSMDDMGDIAALDEELEQSDRFMQVDSIASP